MHLVPSTSATLDRLELRCPPLPTTLVQALALVNEPEEITVRTVTRILEHDPLIVSRLLQTVNSAYYGLQRTVSSAERAVVLLGPVAVVNMMVGMSILKLRAVLDDPAGPCFNRLIRHSVATAYLTRFLHEELPALRRRRSTPTAQAGSGFTAGLLHDFGKIILVYNHPAEASALYHPMNSDERPGETLRDRERRHFGVDHTAAGAFAAYRLSFPPSLVRVIQFHHEPERLASDGEEADDEAAGLAAATAAATQAASAMGYASTRPASWSSVLDAPAWAHYLEHVPTGLETPDALADALRARQRALDVFVQAFSDAKR